MHVLRRPRRLSIRLDLLLNARHQLPVPASLTGQPVSTLPQCNAGYAHAVGTAQCESDCRLFLPCQSAQRRRPLASAHLPSGAGSSRALTALRMEPRSASSSQSAFSTYRNAQLDSNTSSLLAGLACRPELDAGALQACFACLQNPFKRHGWPGCSYAMRGGCGVPLSCSDRRAAAASLPCVGKQGREIRSQPCSRGKAPPPPGCLPGAGSLACPRCDGCSAPACCACCSTASPAAMRHKNISC